MRLHSSGTSCSAQDSSRFLLRSSRAGLGFGTLVSVAYRDLARRMSVSRDGHLFDLFWDCLLTIRPGVVNLGSMRDCIESPCIRVFWFCFCETHVRSFARSSEFFRTSEFFSRSTKLLALRIEPPVSHVVPPVSPLTRSDRVGPNARRLASRLAPGPRDVRRARRRHEAGVLGGLRGLHSVLRRGLGHGAGSRDR